MILEGLVSTENEDGTLNVSPMGPEVDRDITRLLLKPFNTSRTYRNLARIREGVLHVTDDVEVIAKAAIGAPQTLASHAATVVRGQVVSNCCRSFEFRVVAIDDQQERVRMEAEIVHTQFHRAFFGFNRAKHAVLEAAILATRLAILPREQILEEMQRLAIPVEKTAGDQEQRAFALLQQYIHEYDRSESP